MRFHVLMTATAAVSHAISFSAKCVETAGIVFVGDVVLRETRQQFGPGECSLFAIRVDAGLAPDGKEVELGSGDAHLAGFVKVLLGAESATVDLRSADLDAVAATRDLNAEFATAWL